MRLGTAADPSYRKFTVQSHRARLRFRGPEPGTIDTGSLILPRRSTRARIDGHSGADHREDMGGTRDENGQRLGCARHRWRYESYGTSGLFSFVLSCCYMGKPSCTDSPASSRSPSLLSPVVVLIIEYRPYSEVRPHRHSPSDQVGAIVPPGN